MRAGGLERWQPVALHGAAAGLVALTLLVGVPALTLIVGGLVMGPVYLALGLREARRSPIWLSPLSFYLLWYACGMGASAIYMGVLVAGEDDLSFSVTQLAAADIGVAYVLFLAGSVALHAGLQFGRPQRAASATWRPGGRDQTMLIAHALLWVIGLWLLWDFSWVVRLGAFARVFQSLALAVTISFALCRGFGLAPFVFRVALGVATLGLVAANAISYSKASIMYSFIPVAWVCLVDRDARRWLPALGTALAVFYLFVVSPVVMQARMQAVQSESAGSRLVETFADMFSERAGSPSQVSAWEPVDALLRRQFDPAPVSYIAGEVETYGLQYGATMDYIRYAFIPRILWPDKPSVTRGAWFTVYTGFAETEAEATTSTGITATGELYWNFGLPGVLAGMFVIGWLLALLWRLAGIDPRGDIVRTLLYVSLMLQMNNMSEFVTVLVSVAVITVLFGGLLLASKVVVRRSTAAAGITPALSRGGRWAS